MSKALDDAHDATTIRTGRNLGPRQSVRIPRRRLAIVWRCPLTIEKFAAEGEFGSAMAVGHEAEVEITQLRGSDIQKRGDDYFAKLSPSAGKIKTGKARTVPIHEHLVEQGFLAFVEEMGNGPLFYVLPRRPAGKPEPVQSPAERTRARLGNWVRSLGITDPELSPNHAWRHTFKARAERFGMSEKYSDAITGHAPPSAGRKYGKPTPEDLAEALRRFPRYELQAAPNREDLIGNPPEPCKTESL